MCGLPSVAAWENQGCRTLTPVPLTDPARCIRNSERLTVPLLHRNSTRMLALRRHCCLQMCAPPVNPPRDFCAGRLLSNCVPATLNQPTSLRVQASTSCSRWPDSEEVCSARHPARWKPTSRGSSRTMMCCTALCPTPLWG